MNKLVEIKVDSLYNYLLETANKCKNCKYESQINCCQCFYRGDLTRFARELLEDVKEIKEELNKEK